ncbi:MAG: hypothetical protein AB1428_09830 [Bacteroidota bacterium]
MPHVSPPPVTRRQDLGAAALAAALIVATLSLLTPPGQPAHDEVHYLNIAEKGLIGNDSLAAPFAYRCAAPLIVRVFYLLFGLSVDVGFRFLVIVSSMALLIFSYLLARTAGGNHATGLVVLLAVGFSFFHIKGSLAVPAMVDVEAFALTVAAVWALKRNRPGLCLTIACGGLLFKEFLLVPVALFLADQVRLYLRTRETAALRWLIAGTVLPTLILLLPRLLIPVSVAYGANLRWGFGAPDRMAYLENLPRFLSGELDLGRTTNAALALLSYWLPVLLVTTRQRIRALRSFPRGDGLYSIVTLGTVAVLALFGGTNIMVFAAYTAPAMIIVLTRLSGAGIPGWESLFMLFSTAVFNRIPFPLRGITGGIAEAGAFYGAWWSTIDSVTISRFLEIGGWMLLVMILRHFPMPGRLRTPIQAESAD